MLVLKTWKPSSAATGGAALALFAGWGRRLISISHRSMAICGLVVVVALSLLGSREDVRANLESWTFDWLRMRQEAREPLTALTSDTVEDAAVQDDPTAPPSPARLDREQKAVTQWIAKRYRVAPEPIAALVKEAWAQGQQSKLEPTLILAIMAVESSFNPLAQSPVGAQGLMQVMTSVHDDKYQAFGGTHAAFDPVSNLRVGVTVLKECVLRAGSTEGGLRLYVGAGNLEDDGGYTARVLAEQDFLRQVAQGRPVPITARWTPPSSPIASAIQIFSLPSPVAAALPLPAMPAAPAPAPAAAAPAAPLPQTSTAPVQPVHVAPATTSPSAAAPKAPTITEAASVPPAPAPQVKSPDDKLVAERVALLQ